MLWQKSPYLRPCTNGSHLSVCWEYFWGAIRIRKSLNPLLHVAWFGLGWIQVWEIHSHEKERSETIALDPNGSLTGRKYVALAGSYLGENKIEQAKENIEKAFYQMLVGQRLLLRQASMPN